VLPALLGAFSREHPGVTVDLEIGNARAVESDVLTGRHEVGLSEGFAAADGLDAQPFLHDEMVLIARPRTAGGPLSEFDSIRASALRGVPFLAREAGSGTREVVEAALGGRGVELRPAMVLGGTEAIKNAVIHGLGVAIVSRLTVETELEIGRLRAVTMTDLRIRRALHRLTRKGNTPSPAAAEFLAVLATLSASAALP
jgi:DNA-binding transcriptional LysR family regulator